MSAQPNEQVTEGQGCHRCGQPGSDNEPLVDDHGKQAHPLCVEQDTAGEEAEREPEIIQPADLVDEEELSKVVALRTPRGSLTLRPDQTELDPNQHAALAAIGIDFNKDPGIVPHARAFVHMCQIRDLDPWSREAYLIGRGYGDNRKYTMQVGIDGYRKMSARTGRFIRVKKVLWTGQDDDDRSWVRERDEDGDIIRKRVWTDFWPPELGNPGAAKVVIEHYDEQGRITTTAAIADWKMYAPFSQASEWRSGKKVKVTNPDGTPKMVLNDMWEKGHAHMLAKCAEALAHRKAFPATMNGLYIHEEMHRADEAERARVAEQKSRRRVEAFQRATQQGSAPIASAPTEHNARSEAPQNGQREADDAQSGPILAGDVAREVVEDMRADQPEGAPQGSAETVTTRPDETRPGAPETAPDSAQSTAPSDAADASQGAPMSEEERATALRAEFAWQAEQMGSKPSLMAQRRVRMLRKNVEDFTADELLQLVAGFRPMVVSKLQQAGEGQTAARYANVQPEDVVLLDDLLGIVEAEVVPEQGDPTDDPRMDADPTQPHEPVMDGGLCQVCSEEEDNILHAGHR